MYCNGIWLFSILNAIIKVGLEIIVDIKKNQETRKRKKK